MHTPIAYVDNVHTVIKEINIVYIDNTVLICVLTKTNHVKMMIHEI